MTFTTIIIIALVLAILLRMRLTRDCLTRVHGGKHGIFHLHAWHVAPEWEGAVHHHCVCRCGARVVFRGTVYGHSPIDRHWVETGEKLKPVPPSRPSDAGRSAIPQC